MNWIELNWRNPSSETLKISPILLFLHTWYIGVDYCLTVKFIILYNDFVNVCIFWHTLYWEVILFYPMRLFLAVLVNCSQLKTLWDLYQLTLSVGKNTLWNVLQIRWKCWNMTSHKDLYVMEVNNNYTNEGLILIVLMDTGWLFILLNIGGIDDLTITVWSFFS